MFGLLQTSPLSTIDVKLNYSAEFKQHAYEGNELKFHNAGFDAYCTGVLFLKMTKYIHEQEQSKKDSISDGEICQSALSEDFFYTNKLNMMKSSTKYFNLLGPEGIGQFYILDTPDRGTCLFGSTTTQIFTDTTDKGIMSLVVLLLELPDTSNLIVVTFEGNYDNEKIDKLFSSFGKFIVHPLDDTIVMLEFQKKNKSFVRLFEFPENFESITVQSYESFTQIRSPPCKKKRTQ